MKKKLLVCLFLMFATTGFAQHEMQMQCPEEEVQIMEPCRDYLKQKCTASMMPITWPWKRRISSCHALRRRCCQSLAQVIPPSCRCKAVCSAFKSIIQGLGHEDVAKARQMAIILPSTCNMYPSFCNIPPTAACH